MPELKKVVAIGPESTGKSTLCRQLAERYNTLWCPEYARAYLETNGSDYTYEDLLVIAQNQINQEDTLSHQALQEGKNILFIDTDMYVMKVWCEYVFNKCHPFILNQIAERAYDGYFLCHPDLPWEVDPLREYPQEEIRMELFQHYLAAMSAQSAPWADISGQYSQRFAKAEKFTSHLLVDS